MKKFLLIIFFATPCIGNEFLNIYSKRFGVTAHSLLKFHDSIQNKSGSNLSLLECSDQLQKNNSTYLLCLAQSDVQSKKDLFFKTILIQLLGLYKQPQTLQTTQSIELTNYLLDMSRTLLAESKTESFNWYDIKKQKFLNIPANEKQKFPFQNGDVLIAYGDKATSGMISKSTGAGYRFSHAALIHAASESKVTTLESFPHLGAVELPVSSLQQESYSRMLVLRLKKQYTNFAPKAIAQLQSWVANKLPFDPTFSADGEIKNYCTRMVAMSFSKSMSTTLDVVFPDQLREPGPGLDRLHEQVGIIIPKTIISPRSIVRSEFFDIVADYSNSNALLKFWQVDHITGYMEAKMRDGYRIKPNRLFSVLSKVLTMPIEVSFSPLLFKSQQIIRLIGPEKFANLATTEKKIYESSILEFEKQFPEANILNFPPWAVAEALEKILNNTQGSFLTLTPGTLP